MDVETPEPTETWFPISHSRVIDVVHHSLMDLGFNVRNEEYTLARDDQQLFAVLDLDSELADGVSLSVGVRNSINKTLPAGLVGGERVTVCTNLQFGGEVQIARKHTRFCERDFQEKTHHAIASLRQYAKVSEERIARLQRKTLPKMEADSLLLRGYEKGVIASRLLPRLIQEWRQPSYPEFEVRTAWSMLQAFTHVIKDRQKDMPIESARECIAFQNFMLSA